MDGTKFITLLGNSVSKNTNAQMANIVPRAVGKADLNVGGRLRGIKVWRRIIWESGPRWRCCRSCCCRRRRSHRLKWCPVIFSKGLFTALYELNWTTPNKSTQLHNLFIGHKCQRHDHRHRIDKYLANQTSQKVKPLITAKRVSRKMADCPS